MTRESSIKRIIDFINDIEESYYFIDNIEGINQLFIESDDVNKIIIELFTEEDIIINSRQNKKNRKTIQCYFKILTDEEIKTIKQKEHYKESENSIIKKFRTEVIDKRNKYIRKNINNDIIRQIEAKKIDVIKEQLKPFDNSIIDILKHFDIITLKNLLNIRKDNLEKIFEYNNKNNIIDSGELIRVFKKIYDLLTSLGIIFTNIEKKDIENLKKNITNCVIWNMEMSRSLINSLQQYNSLIELIKLEENDINELPPILKNELIEIMQKFGYIYKDTGFIKEEYIENKKIIKNHNLKKKL